MKIEKFVSGKFVSQSGYKSFLPSKINTGWDWDSAELSFLLEKASGELGGLNAFSDLIPNIDVYIKMHIRAEANKSSKIEGTKTTIEEDMLSIEDIAPEKRDDYEEVHNYIKALNYGIDRILNDDFPFCNRLLCQTHKILMQGVRGRYKTPGEFRMSQNWIGGSMPSNALYVPPAIADLGDLLSDFEKFINNDNLYIPHLIKVAIIHYQFETIHPFLDGNGRIGRLLIPLYLLSKKVLDKPCFYISDYFEKHRTEYYDALHRARINNDILGWINFFLEATIHTAQSAKIKFKRVVEVVESYKRDIFAIQGNSANNMRIIETFFDDPYQNGKMIQQKTEINQPTIDRSLRIMLEKGFLIETTGFSRNRMFALAKYVDIFKNV